MALFARQAGRQAAAADEPVAPRTSIPIAEAPRSGKRPLAATPAASSTSTSKSNSSLTPQAKRARTDGRGSAGATDAADADDGHPTTATAPLPGSSKYWLRATAELYCKATTDKFTRPIFTVRDDVVGEPTSAGYRLWCELCKKGIAACKSSADAHIKTTHGGKPTIVDALKSSAAPHVASGGAEGVDAIPADMSSLTSTELMRLVALRLFGDGMSLNAMEKLQDVLPLLQQIKRIPSRVTLRKYVSDEYRALEDALKDVVKGKRVHMVLDSSKTAFSGGMSCTLIYLLAPGLPPILADVVLSTVPHNAEYYKSAILQVCKAWGISADGMYIGADNTAVMPLAIRKAGATFAPCLSHIINLGFGNVVAAFGIDTLMASLWAEVRSGPRLKQLTEAGINGKLFHVPTHRFAAHAAAMAWLVNGVNRANLAAVLRRFSDDDSRGGLAAVIKRITSPLDVAKIHFAHTVTADMPHAIALSERIVSSDSLIPAITKLWMTIRLYYTTRADMVAVYDKREKARLSAQDREIIADALALALEDSDETFLKHLTTSDNREIDIPTVSKRGLWDPTGPALRALVAAKPGAALTKAVVAWAPGVDIDPTDAAVLAEVEMYVAKLHSKAVVMPAGCSLYDFYLSLRTDLPLVSEAALFQLTIPHSNTVAERGFSMKNNREVSNRKLAGVTYVRDLLFSACNSVWVDAHRHVKLRRFSSLTDAVAGMQSFKSARARDHASAAGAGAAGVGGAADDEGVADEAADGHEAIRGLLSRLADVCADDDELAAEDVRRDADDGVIDVADDDSDASASGMIAGAGIVGPGGSASEDEVD